MASILLLGSCAWFEAQTEWVAKNRVVQPSYPPCGPEEYCAEYSKLFIVDLHNDVLLWGRDIREEVNHGHSDLLRLRRGGTNIQVLAVPSHTPLPRETPSGVCASRYDLNTSALLFFVKETLRPWSWFSDKSRVSIQVDRFYHWSEMNKDDAPYLVPIKSRADVMKVQQALDRGEHVVGSLLALEGLHWTGTDKTKIRSEVRQLANDGFRMISLTHRFSNVLAGSSEDCDRASREAGLSPAGIVAVNAILDEGMILDLAHASSETIHHVTGLLIKSYKEGKREAPAALVMSHGGVRMTCGDHRNLSAEDVQRIVMAGGLIGLGYWQEAVCWSPKGERTEALDKIRDAYVATYVALADESFQLRYHQLWGKTFDPVLGMALGSDFDGAVLMRFDAAALPRLLKHLAVLQCDDLASQAKEAFLNTGRCHVGGPVFDEDDIARIAGLNALDLFQSALK